MSESNVFNLNDIVEEYLSVNSKSIIKYLIVKKNVTLHRGTFYDLVTLENSDNETPIFLYGIKLDGPKKFYRKYFDAQKQI